MPARPEARAAVVVLGAGSGSRVGAGVNKVLLPLAGVPVLARSLAVALSVPGIGPAVLVARPGEEDRVAAAIRPHLAADRDVWLVPGGESRHDSERAALAALRPVIISGEVDVVVIHDGARPLAPAPLFTAVIDAARTRGGALPVAPVPGLVSASGGPVAGTPAAVQTPQAFRAPALLSAYDTAAREGFTGTDTAACVERYAPGLDVVGVPASPTNLKITWPEDLRLAASLLARSGS